MSAAKCFASENGLKFAEMLCLGIDIAAEFFCEYDIAVAIASYSIKHLHFIEHSKVCDIFSSAGSYIET